MKTKMERGELRYNYADPQNIPIPIPNSNKGENSESAGTTTSKTNVPNSTKK